MELANAMLIPTYATNSDRFKIAIFIFNLLTLKTIKILIRTLVFTALFPSLSLSIGRAKPIAPYVDGSVWPGAGPLEVGPPHHPLHHQLHHREGKTEKAPNIFLS